MSLDKTIRRNLDGEYIIIQVHQIEEGVEYAIKKGITQIQLRDSLEVNYSTIDFSLLIKMSGTLEILSIISTSNAVNVDALYRLSNLRKIYVNKLKFKLDISCFPRLIHFGGEYSSRLSGIEKSITLKSLVLVAYPEKDLRKLSNLKDLKILHLYRPRITSLRGIEMLLLEELSLYCASSLTSLAPLTVIPSLIHVSIEKCRNIKIEDISSPKGLGFEITLK